MAGKARSRAIARTVAESSPPEATRRLWPRWPHLPAPIPEYLVQLQLKTHWQMITQNPVRELGGIQSPCTGANNTDKWSPAFAQRACIRPFVIGLRSQNEFDFVVTPSTARFFQRFFADFSLSRAPLMSIILATRSIDSGQAQGAAGFQRNLVAGIAQCRQQFRDNFSAPAARRSNADVAAIETRYALNPRAATATRRRKMHIRYRTSYSVAATREADEDRGQADARRLALDRMKNFADSQHLEATHCPAEARPARPVMLLEPNLALCAALLAGYFSSRCSSVFLAP